MGCEYIALHIPQQSTIYRITYCIHALHC